MASTADIISRGKKVLIGNYARQPVVMERGEGSYLWDADGKRYLDLFAGFGGAVLGHSHPALVAAATEQAKRLWHVGNTFYTQPQIEVAERLNRFAFEGKAFFCHSGAESNEAAVKLARLRGGTKSPARWKILSLSKSFHGLVARRRDHRERPAVERAVERDDLPSLRRELRAAQSGELRRGLVGFEPAVTEERLPGERGPVQCLGQLDLRLVIERVADVPKLGGLFIRGRDEGGVTVPQN